MGFDMGKRAIQRGDERRRKQEGNGGWRVRLGIGRGLARNGGCLHLEGLACVAGRSYRDSLAGVDLFENPYSVTDSLKKRRSTADIHRMCTELGQQVESGVIKAENENGPDARAVVVLLTTRDAVEDVVHCEGVSLGCSGCFELNGVVRSSVSFDLGLDVMVVRGKEAWPLLPFASSIISTLNTSSSSNSGTGDILSMLWNLRTVSD